MQYTCINNDYRASVAVRVSIYRMTEVHASLAAQEVHSREAGGCPLKCPLLRIAHANADVYTLGVMAQELSAACAALLGECPVDLPTVTLQYADFACWESEVDADQQQDEAACVALQWWCEKLAALPDESGLPLDRPRLPVQGGFAPSLSIVIDADLSVRMNDLCSAEGATSVCAVWSALCAAMVRLGGKRDLVLGQPFQSRQLHPELNGTLGYFSNDLPVHISQPEGTTFRQAVRSAHKELLLALRHTETSYYRIVRALGRPHTSSRRSIFQVMAQLLTLDRDSPLVLTQEECTAMPDWIEVDIRMSLWDPGRGLPVFGSIHYDSNIYNAESICALRDTFLQVLRKGSLVPDDPLDDLDVFS